MDLAGLTTEGRAAELADLDRLATVEIVRAVVRGHAGVLEAVAAAEPAIARVFTVDILSAGPAALARRRAVLRRFAAHIQALVDDAIAEGAPAVRLDDATAPLSAS